jgi:hypothetical protein
MKRALLALVNLLTVPGLGTWAAGRKKQAMIQGALSVFGSVVTGWPIWSFFRYLRKQGLTVEEFQRRVQSGDVPVEWEPILTVLSISLLGILIFASNWLWSAFTTASEDAESTAVD